MNRQLIRFGLNTLIFVFIFYSCLLYGCGSSADLPAEMSGKWRSDQNNAIVDIQLNKSSKIVTLDGKAFLAEVNTVEKGAYLVKVNVKTETGKTEEWTLQQIWNDNGSDFKLKFSHNGTTEMLTHTEPS